MIVEVQPHGFQKLFKKLLQKRLDANKPRAQLWLDNQIMNDMQPYMPMVTGAFIQQVRLRNATLAGSGVVCAATGVQGRYLYEGKVMVDAATGKGPRRIPLEGGEVIFRYRKGAKLIPTARKLTYSKSANPLAQDHWYEAAEKAHIAEWKDGVKEILINGK